MYEQFNAGQLTLNIDIDDPNSIRRNIQHFGEEAVLRAVSDREKRIVENHSLFMQTEPSRAHLHSALASLSLPVRKPKDEFASIIRQDGDLTLMIKPRSYPSATGEEIPVGVPFGSKARLVLIHVISQAVKNKNPRVYVGKSLSDFMRRLGYQSFSGGKRGTQTFFKDQLLRLARCEWTIRYDSPNGTNPTQLSDVRFSDDMLLWATDAGDFAEEIILNDRFFEHTMRHYVTVDEAALSVLRDDASALDLYLYLAYRLPRIERGVPVYLSWNQLRNHCGNGYKLTKHFSAAIRQKLPLVHAVYPEARIELHRQGVTLMNSPAPMKRTMITIPGGK